jgi:hypothetical protein
MFVEDLSTFFDTTTGFAVSATVLGQTVPVIFDKAYFGAMGGLVESTGPQCLAQTSTVASVVQGTAIVINATTYTVTGVEPDGTGITVLQLRG